MENIVRKYNASNASNLELEISYTAELAQFPELCESFRSLSERVEIVQNVDVYYSDNSRRTIAFVDGTNQHADVYIRKELLAKPLWLGDAIKMKLNVETPVPPSTTSIKSIRAKLRARFILDAKFGIELDLIKKIDKNAGTLKQIVGTLFTDRPFIDTDISLFDELKIETEFKAKPIDIQDLNRSMDLISATLD
ncbi:hypothetical protein FI667_g2562, partial [Globisporangium splendens]